MNKGYFITGTDTGVGKTLVAGALTAWAAKRNIPVGVMKPVETGISVNPADAALSDAAFLSVCAGGELSAGEITQYTFQLPAAPSVAARHENRAISIPLITGAFQCLSSRYTTVIVEGAGGLQVPLTDTFTMCDLAKELALPVILVAGNRLGAINHTILSIDCILGNSLELAGIIFNNLLPGENPVQQTNPRETERLRPGLPYSGILPFRSDFSTTLPEPEKLLDWISAIPEETLHNFFRV